PDHRPFDLGEPGSGVPHVHEPVEPAGQEIRQSGRVQPTPRDEGQIAGTRRVEGLGRASAHGVKGLRQRPAVLLRARAEGGDNFIRAVQVNGGRRGEVPDDPDKQVESRLPHGPHVICRELEWIGGCPVYFAHGFPRYLNDQTMAGCGNRGGPGECTDMKSRVALAAAMTSLAMAAVVAPSAAGRPLSSPAAVGAIPVVTGLN